MSCNFNHIVLVGRLVKNPEIKHINETTTKCYFTLAISRNYRKEDGTTEADFIPVCIWGKLADVAFQLLKKGSATLIWGRLQIRNYEKDNETKWITEVIAENFQILERLPKPAEPATLPTVTV